jgi:hypothetical protein
MIGRPKDWNPKPFELTRWARSQAGHLSSRAAHLLLILASYAEGNPECQCWPGIRSLTEDLGLTVHERRDGSAHNSQVYEALRELEAAQLVWRQQRRRTSTLYELLLPSDWQEGKVTLLEPGAKPSDKPSGSSVGEVPGVDVPAKSHQEDLDRHPPAHRRVSTSTAAENGNGNGGAKRIGEIAQASLAIAKEANR